MGVLFILMGLVLAVGRVGAQAAPAAQAAEPAMKASQATAASPAGRAGSVSAVPTATVQQPRPFGYVIGDLLTQWVLLETNGRAFEPASMPADGRVGAWFERRGSRIETRSDGRRWLAVEYQVTNAPRALTTIRLPAWELKAKTTGAVFRVPDWAISVGPVTKAPAEDDTTPQPMRPDRAAPTIATFSIERRLWLWSAATVFTLVVWLGWLLWRNHLTASNQPFAKAYREISRTDESAPAAWQSLHRAFDRTAGRVVQPESLNELFTRAPYLLPVREKIEQFFAQSSARFFGDGGQTAISPRALSNDLRRLEKRHER